MYKYEFTSPAAKDIKKLPPNIQKRIIKKLDYFVASSQPLSFAGRLTDYRIGSYRFRIGDYRVIFDLEDETLIILTLGHRKDIYR
jgi:mRNA interferase RelE/StbE